MRYQNPEVLGLPHREPFVFVDEIRFLEPGERAQCVKVFPAKTDFFRGHFPGNPIVPGVLLTEALAQTAGIAAGQPGKGFRLSAIRAMKFPDAVKPDEEITLYAKKLGSVGGLWQFEVRAQVGERVVADGSVVLNEA